MVLVLHRLRPSCLLVLESVPRNHSCGALNRVPLQHQMNFAYTISTVARSILTLQGGARTKTRFWLKTQIILLRISAIWFVFSSSLKAAVAAVKWRCRCRGEEVTAFGNYILTTGYFNSEAPVFADLSELFLLASFFCEFLY